MPGDIPPMTAAEYNAACEALGLTPTYGIAPKLGISIRQAGRYSRGEKGGDIPDSVAAHLRTLLELQQCRADLAACQAKAAKRR